MRFLPRRGWRIVLVSPSGNRFADARGFWLRSSAVLAAGRLEALPGWTMHVVRSWP